MAYRADIEIAVKGARQLKELQDQIKVTGSRISVLNDNLNASAKLIPKSFNNINAVLAEAAKNFNEVTLGTGQATTAAREYYQASKVLNNALRERFKLLNDIEKAERGVVLANIKASQAARAASGFAAFSADIDVPTQKSIRRNQERRAREQATAETLAQIDKLNTRQEEFITRTNAAAQAAARQTAEFYRQARAAKEVAKINAAAGPAQLLLAPAAPGAPVMGGGARRRITGPVERLGGARTEDQAAVALRLAENIKQQVRPLSQVEFLYRGIAVEAAKLQQIKALPDSKMLDAAARGLQTIESIEKRRLTTAERRAQKLKQIEDYYGDTGMANAGFGIQGPALPPPKKGLGANLAKAGGFGGVVGAAIPGAIISAAFPLLTGQGMGGAVGGGVGGLAGGILGALLGGPGGAAMGSFAGGLVGSLIGDLFDQAQALTKEFKQQQALLQAVNGLETRRSQLTVDIAKAQQQGNEALALELERRQKNNEIAQQLFETLSKLEADERNKTKEGARVVELEKERAGQAAARAVNENNVLTALRQQQVALDKQVQASDMLAERRFAGIDAVSAQTDQVVSVENARYDMLLKLNDLELQRARNAGNTTKEYELQLSRAQLVYQQTVLQIEQEVQRNKLAAVREQVELLRLQAQLKDKEQAGQNVELLQRSVYFQQQAVTLALQGVSAAQQMAQYQLTAADAIRQMTVEQAAFNRVQAAGRAGGGALGGGGGAALGGGGGAGGTVVSGITSATDSYRVERAAKALSAEGVTGTFDVSTAEKLLGQIAQAKADKAAAEKKERTEAAKARGAISTVGFAEGGFVTRPTNAIIGEGGESEYVIPSSKMNAAMQRYSAGVRGEAVTAGAVTAGSTSTANYSSQQNAYYGGGGASVNITTGPVIRMNNRDYVTMADMQRGMAAAANAGQANMMRQMGRSYATRRSMGL